MNELIPSSSGGEFLLYKTEDGRTRLEVRVQQETVWLSLNQMAELFQRDKSVISRHIKNLFDEGELAKDRVVANFATTAADGQGRRSREQQTKAMQGLRPTKPPTREYPSAG